MESFQIMIAAGGTGGHLFPGIAIAEEIRRSHPEVEVVFAGTARGFESKVLSELGWPMVVVGATSMSGGSFGARVLKWSRLPITVFHALLIFTRSRPRLLVSIGGHAAAPLAIAAWILRIPFVIVEPNAIAGFTNRKLGRFCRRAFVQFEESKKYFPERRVSLTGMPVRKEVSLVARREKLPGERVTIFAFGGSQGSVRINRALLGATKHMADIKTKIRILHQTGRNDDARIYDRAYAEEGIEARVFEFTDRIWELYADADIIVSRAGGITAAETSALAIPTIMVPYPHAKGHQKANATALARIGGSVMIEDSECTAERLAREIGTLVDHPEKLKAMRENLSKFGKPGAARTIVEEMWKTVTRNS